MKSLLTIILVLVTAVNLMGCSGDGADRDRAISAPAVVVIYGKLNNDKFGNVYYGEDTRGKMYIIEKGKFNLDLQAHPVHFVKIADYKGKWYIEKVLENAPEII